jgi:predicted DNA-binding ArsR family transcriptional regulator
MKQKLIDSAIDYFKGKIAYHKSNVEVYLNNPAGIGEHSDIMEAIEQEVEKVAEYQDKLEVMLQMRGDASEQETLFS